MRGTINLTLDASHELPILSRSGISTSQKWAAAFDFLKISIKLFTVHRIKKIHKEKVLGFTIYTFDYGALHFLFREIFVKNTYYFKSTKNNLTIFDCGANIGIAMFYFKWLYPKSIIHAFEPDPKTFELLQKNVEVNKLKNVFLHNVALYNKSGHVTFYTDHKNPGWLTMSTVKERLPGKDSINVKCEKLSNYIKEDVDFLKMDVEGSENDIFAELLKSKKLKRVKKIALEYHLNKKNSSAFPKFLTAMLKENYEIELSADRSGKDNTFQDVMMYMNRP